MTNPTAVTRPPAPPGEARAPAATRADLRLVVPALAAWGSAALGAYRPRLTFALIVALALLALVGYAVARSAARRAVHRGAAGPAARAAVRRAARRAAPRAAHYVAAGPAARVAARRPGPTRAAGAPLPRAAVPLACAAVACALGGLVATTARTATRAGPLADLARDRAVVTLDLTVTDDPRPLTGRVVGAQRIADTLVVDARAERVTRGATTLRLRRPVAVFARGPGWTDRLPGERLRVRGRLRAPLRAGAAPLFEPYAPPERLHPAPAPARVAGRLRAGLRDAAAVLPPAERGLLPGLVVGDTTRLDPAVREDFRRTGLTHLVAVSGQNVAVLLAAVLLVARRCGVGPRTAAALGGAGLAFFVVLARPSPSVLRAATMGAFGLVGTVTGRERAALRLLAGAALFLVLLDPALARSLGFALSTAATAGLLVLGPPWRARLARRLPGWLADAVAAPLAAQVACAPLLAAAFGRVSLVAVPANLLAAPAVAPATICGFVAAALAPVATPLARLAARLAGLPVGWLVAVARNGATVPAANLPVPTGLAGAALTVALAAAAALLLARRAGRLAAATATVAVVSAAATVTYVAPAWPPPRWRLVACDVGQGDALVVRTSVGAVVVDTGPDPLAVDRCLRGLRVDRLAAVVLTHFHADHVEGLPGVLRSRRAPQVVVSPLGEPAEERERVGRWTAERRIPVRVAALDERWSVGDAAFEVLGPETAFRGTESDPNNSSLVLRLTAPGMTLLLTGDIEEPAQLALLARGAPGRADVLKVPHHGSGRQTAELLDATGAAAAIVSAGRDNPYGHPAPRTLAALGERGMRTYRTDLDGDVAVSTGPHGVRVTGRRGPGTPPRAPTPAERALAFRRAAAPALWCPVAPASRRPPPSRSGPPTPGGPRADLRSNRRGPAATMPRYAALPRRRPALLAPAAPAAPARAPPDRPRTAASASQPPRARDILSPCPPRPRSRR